MPGDADRSSYAARVERAAVWILVGARFVNVVQLAVALPGTVSRAERPWLDAAAATIWMLSAGIVVCLSWRASQLDHRWVMVDVIVGLVVVLAAPHFLRPDQLTTWAAWPYPLTLLSCSVAGSVMTVRRTAVVTTLFAGSYLSWLAGPGPQGGQATILSNTLAYPAFAFIVLFLMRYLRKLAVLADEGQEAIQHLAEERTRRVLHTPYRLLHGLTDRLRHELVASGADETRQAQLAEAVASINEIEMIVRGTTPATGNLNAELRSLRDQFVDLPLVMNVDGVRLDVDADSSYRVREAVRSALQNVRAHASANQVVVFATRDDDRWLVSVYDDGVGFDPRQRAGLGINGLVVAAIEEIGGSVRIESAPSEGTMIEITGPRS